MMGLLSSVPILAERVLNSIPEGMLIALLAWLLLRLVGRQNSGTRFAVWFVALLAIAVIPFVPAMHVAGSVGRTVHAEVTLPGSWAVAILGLWGLTALFATSRLLLGFCRLRTLRRDSTAKDLAELDPVIEQTLAECNGVRQVELRISSRVGVPTVIGFFKPVILIPDWALRELTPEELRTVILHEFAHLRRRDDWTNLAQKIIRAMFFFHPAVLWIDKRLSLEREMACDEVVLAETKNPHAYARCLVSLAEKSFVRRSVAMAQAAIGRVRDTSLRLAQILDVDRPRATRVFRPAIAAVAGVFAISFAVLPNLPRLIAFQNPAETPVSVAVNDLSAQIPNSMIVPAAARVRSPQSDVAILRETKGGSAADAQWTAHPSLTMTRVKRSVISKRPRVLQASLKQPAVQQMLVFTETTDYYQHGSGIVGVTEWRVVLVNVPVRKTHVGQASNRT